MKTLLTFIFIFSLLSSCHRQATTNNNTLKYSHQLSLKNIAVPSTMLPCNCHTQGVAWCTNTNQLIVSCQGKDGFSYLLLFPDYANIANKEAITVIKTDGEGRGFSHPSAIQIHDGLMPVALAGGKKEGTFIVFYEIKEGEIVESSLPKITYPKHLGALAINKIGNKLVLLGMGWDAEDYAIWVSDLKKYDFKLLGKGKLSAIAEGELGAYNSIWMGALDTGENILMASCGHFFNKKNNFLDIFLIDYKETSLFLKKKERIYVNNTTQNTCKSLFFEGVTVRNIQEDSIRIIATPQDFKRKKDTTYLRGLYEGYLTETAKQPN